MKNAIHLTKFEKSVYRAVMEIPLGQTRTYQWVARRIGNHKSARAVGNALNKNPFAPYIPCHRVIGSCGALGGYRGGLKKKIAILKKEFAYKKKIEKTSGNRWKIMEIYCFKNISTNFTNEVSGFLNISIFN